MNCEKSFSASPCCIFSCNDKNLLFLGNTYQIYLYFGMPSCTGFTNLTQARLVLFKIPIGDPRNQMQCRHDQYCAYSLCDFFSVYNCMYAPPKIDERLKVVFHDNPGCSYTEINVTGIARAWLNESVENKGILITGDECTRCIAYASDRYAIPGMRPMLRLTYDTIELCRPLNVSPCIVEVNA